MDLSSSPGIYGVDTIRIYFDYSRAFDSMLIQILLKKLDGYGVKGKCGCGSESV